MDRPKVWEEVNDYDKIKGSDSKADSEPQKFNMTKIRIFILFTTFIVLAVVGSIAISYAKGYRFGFEKESITITPRGLLVVNSNPNAAQIFIDGRLETATNATIPLPPKTYEVVIKKDGYITWQKQLTIEKEVVTQVDVLLVPSAPSLTALTFSGVINPTMSPDLSKIAYGIASDQENGEKAGLWVLETINLPLGFNRDPRQITDGDVSEAKWEWSPDGRDILLTNRFGMYLLNSGEFTGQAQRINVSLNKTKIQADWKTKQDKRLEAQLSKLPDEIEEVFVQNATNIKFAPDEDKILYTASGSATIPEGIVKPLPGASTQAEERNLVDKAIYVYDVKEDKNFKISDTKSNIEWLPNSLNLLDAQEGKVIIMDYDSMNKQIIFSGNYLYPFAFPSTSENRILILTNLGGSSKLPNLYWLSLN